MTLYYVMIKIGIYAGCFDPPHNGHLWVIKEGQKHYDHFKVVIGPNNAKRATFPVDTRIAMFRDCGIEAVALDEKNIVEYAKRFMGNDTVVSLVRGIRDDIDLYFERGIANAVLKACPELHTHIMLPPEEQLNVSSTLVKNRWSSHGWESVSSMVPDKILPHLKYYWMALPQEDAVASIFETGTAGFATPPSWRDGITIRSTSGHEMIMEDENKTFFGKMREHYEKMIKFGFIDYPETISASQVHEMLDPFPENVVSSDTFNLRWVPTAELTYIGERYLACSQSLGPIIVDFNILGTNPKYGTHGNNLVIEGKHRLLDARDRGDRHILAWVGEKAFTS